MIVNSTKVQVTMSHKATIRANRYTNGELSPILMDIKFELCSLNDNAELVHNRVSRVLYFIENVMKNSIFITPDISQEFSYIVSATTNNLIFCPSAPSDEVIALVIYAKINSLLGDNNIYLGDIHIKSSDNELSADFDSSEFLTNANRHFSDFMNINNLEYCDEYKMVHLLPWWDRDDGFTYELILSKDDEREPSDFYSSGEIQDPLSDFPDYVSDDNEDDTESDAMIIKLGTNQLPND